MDFRVYANTVIWGETGMEKIAFLFPGLGSHYVGMSKNLHQQYAIARETFEEASDILKMDLAKLCFEGGISELNRAENFHPALLTAEVVAYRVYMQEVGVSPEFCAGHSLGEYAALTCAGAIRFGDAVQITRELGLLTQAVIEAGNGAMTIITGIDKEAVEDECRKITTEARPVWISCYNSPNETAISGHQEAIEQVETNVLEKGAQITPLIASAPNHSPLMGRVAENFRRYLAGYSYYSFKWPVIANATAQPYGGPDQIQDILIQQLLKPVQWVETLSFLNQSGVTMTVELGPQNVLSQLVAATTPDIRSFAFGQKKDRLALVNFLKNYSCSDQNVEPLNSVDFKVNHKVLEEPAYTSPDLDNDFIPPLTEVEHFLKEVWVELLGQSKVSINDDFFDLGGHSLLVSQLITKIYQQFRVELPFQKIYESPTIFGLAKQIEMVIHSIPPVSRSTPVVQQQEKRPVTGIVPLTPEQAFYLNRWEELIQIDLYNVLRLFEVDNDFSPAILKQALNYIWKIHDVLRARFIRRGARWKQIIDGPEQSQPDFREYNLTDTPVGNEELIIKEYTELLHRSINITHGPLMITAYLNFGPKRPGRLMLLINHLVNDANTFTTLIKDLIISYRQISEGKPAALPEKNISIKEWAELLHEYLLSDRHLKTIDYWLELPWNTIPDLPIDYPENRSQNLINSIAKVKVALTEEETNLLIRQAPLIFNTEVENILLWALTKVISEWTGSKLVEIDLFGSGHDLIPDQKYLDLSRTLGLFATKRTLMLKNVESVDLLREISLFCRQIKEIPGNGYGYFLAAYLNDDDQVAKLLRKIRKHEIIFNYRGSLIQMDDENDLFKFVGFDDTRNPLNDRFRTFIICGDIINHRLTIVWEYSYNLCKKETVDGLVSKYMRILKDFIKKLKNDFMSVTKQSE
jgi:[acyl-carrier-protein] S-malonyltransferase